VAEKAQSIAIVSHSMGGLVAAYYLAYGAQPPESAAVNWYGAKLIDKAVFFGTPFLGSMIAFRSFDRGSGLPKSERLLPADAMASFPSMYELLPLSATLRDKKGAKLSVDLFDPALWKKHHFGLLRRTNLGPAFLESRERFVTEQLARARRWSELIQLGPMAGGLPPANFHVLNVVGTGGDTLDGGYLDAATGRLYFDPADVTAAHLPTAPLFENGDRTVTMASAAVPAAFETVTKQVVVQSPHDQLFLDPEADKEYKLFLAGPGPKP
jgi:pimeloyl-ACP methyl ester carboxylesterase